MCIAILSPGIPFPGSAFPYRATIYAPVIGQDDDGAPVESDGSGVTLDCDLAFDNPTGKTVSRVDAAAPFGIASATLIVAGVPAVAIDTDTRIALLSGPLGTYDTAEEWKADGAIWDRGSGLSGISMTRRS